MFKPSRSHLDYEKLLGLLKTKKTATLNDDVMPADKVRSRMRKIAFDVYSIDNDPYDGLWKLELNADDGKEYLVRMDAINETSNNGWTATSSENGNNITLAYKDVPVQRLSGKIFGFSKNDVGIFKKALVEKIAHDNGFRDMIVGMLTDENKVELVKAFPELMVRKK